jgi:hypothetical protein
VEVLTTTSALVLSVVSADALSVNALIHTLDQLVSVIKMMTPAQEMLTVTTAVVRNITINV